MPRPAPSPMQPTTVLWVLRAAWAASAVVTAVSVAQATDGRAAAARAVAPVAWWLAVGVVVVALLVPSAAGLTTLRMVTPATVPASVVAWALGASAAVGVAGVVLAVLTTVVSMSGEVGEAMVQGAAYGDERRLPLRVPAPLLPPMVVSWVVWCAAVLGGVMLLAADEWPAGVPVVALAGAFSWLLWRRFHRLSRRWLVLVPAGVVVHDHLVLGETLMVQRTNVAGARLALAGTEAADLTGPAGGHAVEVTVREMVLAVFPSTRAEPKGRAIHVQSFLVGPTRPGRALQAMLDRSLPVD